MRRKYINLPGDFYEWSKTKDLFGDMGSEGLTMVLRLWLNSAVIDDFNGVYHGMTAADVGALSFSPEDYAYVPAELKNDRYNCASRLLLEYGFLKQNERDQLVLVDWDRIANGREEE